MVFIVKTLGFTEKNKRMTKDILYLLLRASITASLSDRDAFIDKVSKVIEHHTHQDPEAARHISDQIAGAMEGLSTSLLLHQLFSPHKDKKTEQTLDRLSLAVEKLNSLLEEAGIEPEPSKSDEQ